MPDPTPHDTYETVIGLEVHCELRTATKLFCGCRNAFGDEPNTNVCPVCLGLPGSLPVVNAMAVELAAKVGIALGCDVRPSVFARKNAAFQNRASDVLVEGYRPGVAERLGVGPDDCLARNPRRLQGRAWFRSVEVVQGDVTIPSTLHPALRRCRYLCEGSARGSELATAARNHRSEVDIA